MTTETNRSWAVSNFRESAVRVFLTLWFDFESHSKGIDANVDDTLFQQLRSRYVAGLKAQLLNTAERSLSVYCGDRTALRKNLNDQVAQNVSAFIMRANALCLK